MKITVSKPCHEISKYRGTPENYTDIEAFYSILPSVLDDMNLEYRIIDRRTKVPVDTTLHLAWHNHGDQQNTWYLKSGYLPNYFYFDKTGYSGWGTLVDNYTCDVDSATANEFVNEFATNMIANNISRMPQAEEVEDIQEPYVLVLGQKWFDNVLPFSYFKDELLDMVTALYKGSEYNVVFKPHPLNKGEHGVHGNLHKLVAGATAVYTMNSGSGFEALFHNKRVFTTGVSDYHWASTPLTTKYEFEFSKNMLDIPVDTDRTNKFLYYCMAEYFMDTTNVDSIRKKIQQAIDQASQSVHHG